MIILVHRVPLVILLYKFKMSRVCVHAKLFPTCQPLFDPRDCSWLGSSVHGIVQARILEGVAMPSSRGSPQPRDQTRVSRGSCITGKFFTAEPLGMSVSSVAQSCLTLRDPMDCSMPGFPVHHQILELTQSNVY